MNDLVQKPTGPLASSETSALEKAMLEGDLSRLTEDERVAYYGAICRSLKLNPLTRPFDYIKLNGKLVLYARKDCTEQLRKVNEVSVDALDVKFQSDLYIVLVSGHDKTGRTDSSTGIVQIKGLVGDALANACMKAETKAKRRFTLSICGLGMVDESELETIPARSIQTNHPVSAPKKISSVKMSDLHKHVGNQDNIPDIPFDDPANDPPSQQESPGPAIISEAQQKRFWAIARKSGKSDAQVKDYIGVEWGLTTTKDITMDIYETCCKWAEDVA